MKNNKKYLKITITTHNGLSVENPLKLSEAHLISKMAQENKKLEIKIVECDAKSYKFIFG